ncbi:MAG: NAD(P)-dependent alcohol dehydrogenase [Actinomycetales bacterium]|nr:NAD(P)-dependent alcohol dehydrogenase [Actinomycetales bacterium]
MKAAVRHTYGPPSVIRIEDRPRPEPGEGEVLIRVAAAAANPLDWHFLRGAPRVMRLQSGLRRPKEVRLGQDVAGVIEAVGPGVTRWAVGDEVLGSCLGAYAEHAITGQDELVAKPAAMSFAEAAGLPVAGSTALQGLRDHCRLSAGQRVLITGAGGGVGHLAVQIAHAMGAHVTAVCSTGNVELVRSLGADVAVDYTREDVRRTTEPFDVIFDLAAALPYRDLRRLCTPRGVISVAGSAKERPMRHLIAGALLGPFASQRMPIFVASIKHSDLEELTALVDAGKLRVEVSRTYPLGEVAAAIGQIETGRTRGKVVVTP